MSRNNWFGSLFARSHGSVPRGRQSRLAVEPLAAKIIPFHNEPGQSGSG